MGEKSKTRTDRRWEMQEGKTLDGNKRNPRLEIFFLFKIKAYLFERVNKYEMR